MSAVAPRRPGRRRRRAGLDFVQDVLFEVDVQVERRYYRQMLEALARSDFGAEGLAAEVTVSKVFGPVWAAQPVPRNGGREEAFGLGLVEYARLRRDPVALALLRTVAVIAPVREVREAAAAGADQLEAAGLPEPAWSQPPGASMVKRCWAYADIFGDYTTVMAEFGDGTQRPAPSREAVATPAMTHAVVVQVDHSLFSVADNVMLVESVEPMLRDLRTDAKNSEPMVTLRQVEPSWVARLLSRAFARTDLVGGVEVWPGFADLRALAMARVRQLPDSAEPADPDPRPPNAASLASLVAEFLASDEASPLPDPAFASAVVDSILAYGLEYDPTNVARVSPAKWDTFLHDWWPARPAPSGDPADVLRAWSRWAARRMPLPQQAREELATALDASLAGWR